MFPIVIAYNGRDHFVLTIPCSEKDYLAWKVHKEFGSLAAATLLVTKELDRPSLLAGAAQGIKAIEKAIEENLPKISKKLSSTTTLWPEEQQLTMDLLYR